MISKYFMMSWIHAEKKILLKDINNNWPWAEVDNRWFAVSAIVNVQINLFRHQVLMTDPINWISTRKFKWEYQCNEFSSILTLIFFLVFCFFHSKYSKKYISSTWSTRSWMEFIFRHLKTTITSTMKCG